MKWNLRNILREDNVLSLGANLLLAATGFAGFALLARSLAPSDFAQWVLFISGGSLFEMLRFGITSNGLVRFLSGSNPKDAHRLIGANTVVSILVTALLALLLLLIRQVFFEAITNSSFNLFFIGYPIVSVLNIPYNNALAILQARMKFARILFIRAIFGLPFFIFLLINYLGFNASVSTIVAVYASLNLMVSSICVLKGWGGMQFLLLSDWKNIKLLLNFGKYSTFTLIGTNLLRNADVLLIGLSPFGSEAVALFSIPLKLTELQQIPLRSFTATAYPKMSKASMEGRINDLRNLFHVYAGAITYLFVVISIITFVFAEEFIILISGYQYLDIGKTGIDIVLIVKILSIYGLLLPLDRMTGIGLDSLNSPRVNALKVGIMLAANVLGDLVALYLFESIEMVAVSTLIFTAIGIWVGAYFLDKKFPISAGHMVSRTHYFYKYTIGRRLGIVQDKF